MSENNSQSQSQIVAVNIGEFSEKISQSLTCTESKSGALRFAPMSRKSFALTADGANLKGKALKRAHFAYLDKCANELNGVVAASIASGKSKVVGFTANAKGNGGNVRLETAEHFNRHDVGPSKRQLKLGLTEADALALIAKAQGISVDEVKAALELAAAK